MTPRLTLDPTRIANKYVQEVQQRLDAIGGAIHVLGLVANEDAPSMSYARATRQKFQETGISYTLTRIPRLELEDAILAANDDPRINGLFVYLPVFNNEQDVILRNLVDYRKDIEGGGQYWTRKLYSNERLVSFDGELKKALLPCTPLAIIKMLTEADIYQLDADQPLADKIVTVFNRSEVVGRPLAAMLSNDGALVYSFDINGPLVFEGGKPSEIKISRRAALAQSDIVVTGVPSKDFPKVRGNEIKPGTACVNFSYFPNIDNDVASKASVFIPKVGPVTVAMCLRNTLRLYENFHQESGIAQVKRV